MPPKKRTNVKQTEKNQYALIWWTIDGSKTIAELSKIPKPKRVKDETVKLLWKDGNGKKKYHFAKIIEFGETIEELDNISLDSKGNVCDKSNKMFSQTVMNQKKTLDMSQQIAKAFEKKNNQELEKIIAQTQPIFPIENPPLLNKGEDKINKFKSKSVTDELAKENTEQSLLSQESSHVYAARQCNKNLNGIDYLNNVDLDLNNSSFSGLIAKSGDVGDPTNDGSDVGLIWNDPYLPSLNGMSEINLQVNKQTCLVLNEDFSSNILEIENPPLLNKGEDKINKFKSKSVTDELAKENTEQSLLSQESSHVYAAGQCNKNLNSIDYLNNVDLDLKNSSFSGLFAKSGDVGDPTNDGLDVGLIWNDPYLPSLNGMSEINLQVNKQTCLVLNEDFSSNILEIGNQQEKTTPIIQLSSAEQGKKKITRPWESEPKIDAAAASTQIEVAKEKLIYHQTAPAIIKSFNLRETLEIPETTPNGALSTFLCNEVRKSDLEFIKMLEQSMSRALESFQRYDRQSTKTLKIPAFYTSSGDHMTKLANGSMIYFPTHIKKRIEERCQEVNGECDWTLMIKLALEEVYDDNISNYTAKGSNTGSNEDSRPAIDQKLYNALFEWIREKTSSTQIITTKMFNSVINKFSYNKRTNDNMQPNSSNKSEEADFMTEKNLQFLKKLVQVSEESYNMQQKELLPERQSHQLSDVFTKPSKKNVKISPNYEIYLSEATYLFILRQSENVVGKYNWRTLVKTTLLEVYGTNLKNYSAKGKRGGCPPINRELFRALYDWACLLVSETIPEDEYIDHINNLAANKKKEKKNK